MLNFVVCTTKIGVHWPKGLLFYTDHLTFVKNHMFQIIELLISASCALLGGVQSGVALTH